MPLRKDFTLKVYYKLLSSIINAGYSILTFKDYLSLTNPSRFVILRHDIDKSPQLAVKMAELENSLGVESSYYFRIVRKSNNPNVIKRIAELGHEIGYHYEDFTLAKGNYKKAISLFEKNLKYFRKFYPVKTIVSHGSPLTKWNNEDIWSEYSYTDFGIIGEPSFDVDFNEVFYLTDTGRSWAGEEYIVRDKVVQPFQHKFSNTFDILNSLRKDKFPEKVLLTAHSQRWQENVFLWIWELLSQNVKNMLKKLFFVRNTDKSN